MCDCYKLRPGALWRRKDDQRLVTVVRRLDDDRVHIAGPEGLKEITKLDLAETHNYVGAQQMAA